MLINVTSFFRDPDTFEALKNTIFPRLITEDSRKQALRIWVPGCSTGEEVYSLAIVLFEFLGNQINTTPIQIFATDIDKDAIDKARQGIYPPSIAEDVEPERLRRFFIKTAVGYQICKTIRNVCVFAVQNVTKDPPFSRLNLICCRNLFIYLGTVLQKKVLHTFHYALRPDGILMLGTSETIGSEASLFSLIDKKSKIYSRKSLPGQTNIAFSAAPYIPFLAFKPAQTQITPAIEVQQVAEKLILEKYGPPSVIIDQNMQILHFRGQTGPYIEPSAGSASLNLLKMARQELVVHLRAAVHHTIKEHCSVRKEGITLHHANSCRNINLQVIPLSSSQETIAPSYLVLFEPGNELPVQKTSLRAETHSTGNRNQRIKELESELLAEREYMRSVIEEQEGTNEELQSANEEIQSANEELQSTNEELETAKEELQSTNEELTTIIEEQGNRNQELNLVKFAQLEQGETAPPCETLRRAKNGRLFKIWLTTSLLLNEAGNPSAVALTEREIT
ncbi:MAG: CheR family methyltransferase [Nitrosomonas sp.]|nr:CheR family methyltransferase [Nitrosomonas sp.]MDP1950205.1 CheR family methyltransferase [Nitrosomonas sp.]